MRRCFQGRWICPQVYENHHFVWRRLFLVSIYMYSVLSVFTWSPSDLLPAPDYAAGIRFGYVHLSGALCYRRPSKAFNSIHGGKIAQIFLGYRFSKETLTAIMMICENTKVKVCCLDGNTDFFYIVAGILQGDILAPYLFIICQDYVLWTLIDLTKEYGFYIYLLYILFTFLFVQCMWVREKFCNISLSWDDFAEVVKVTIHSELWDVEFA